jgi:hypothetical protein
MKIIRFFLLTLIFAIPTIVGAQNKTVQPIWEQPVKVVLGNEAPIMAPSFIGATFPNLPNNALPVWVEKIALAKGVKAAEITLDSISFIPFTSQEAQIIDNTQVPQYPAAEASVMFEQGKPYAIVSVIPFGIDPTTGVPAKVSSFSYTLKTTAVDTTDSIVNYHHYAKNSRLSYGDWYKIWVKETGIHQISFDDMRQMGIPVDGINPDNIQMFGRGGAILNEKAGNNQYDDLTEISIRVVTATPGVFKQGDYILFYGEGPLTWRANKLTGHIKYAMNLYTDKTGYFITVANTPGLRIPMAEPVIEEANTTSDKYTALAVYGSETYNLIKSGRKWFSDKFDQYTRTLNLPEFNFPDIDTSSAIQMGYGFAGRATAQMTFNIDVNNKTVNTTTIARWTGDNDYARDMESWQNFKAASGNLKVQVRFIPPNSAALGWLDYISFNVRSKLRFHGPQMSFRDPESVGDDKIVNFKIEGQGQNLEVWDVTTHSYAHQISLSQSGNEYTMKVKTPWLREFIVFDKTSFLKPEFDSKVANQNLHGLRNYGMIIITNPIFDKQAERLAALHNKQGDVTAKVINLPDIYNEFSSGQPDITAIRDFMKLLYDKGSAQGYPKYLLLFGTGSYDYKNRVINNSNFVPVYESFNSVQPTVSFVTDDYYGCLDDGEGVSEYVSGLLDIGIGRLPVRNVEQAEDMVNKIEAYLMNDSLTHGDWRNNLIVLADDEDSNTHLTQAEGLCHIIANDHPLYNVNKIYFDAFRQNNTPGGGRYPDVNRELNSYVDRGALITNYIGHGGELGWADERVLELVDIQAWKNFNRMGLFFTATCEFSRYDDPQLVSAGELVFLNPYGGAMAMITTTRLAYASTNQHLNESFIDTVLNKNGGIAHLGDIIKYTKNDNPVSANLRHLTLFGDPALKMPIPKYNIVTTSLIDPSTLTAVDTLKANSKVTITGEVQDLNNQTMNGFNGNIFVKVFDKTQTVRTLGQDPKSIPVNFQVQKSVIYQGEAKVKNGLFTFTFPVPRDIDYNFGHGKISYYATDGYNDAQGYYTDFIIGGSKNVADTDLSGPDITLFINDTSFVDGDLTSENPKLLVKLFDQSGINILGNGVGHDLVAILDENSYNSAILNDFYVADRDSYQSGWAKYQFFNLEDGPHSVTVKAWDVFNNSSEASVNFVVKHNIRLDIDNVIAYPNPSKGKVWFRFKHNLFDAVLNIQIEIYNSTGTLVKVLNPGKVTANGYMVDEIAWDGLSSDGKVLRNGLYVCRVKVLDRNGNSSAHTVKVVMAK